MDSSAYMGQIALFPYGWAPENWAKCDGKLILCNSNPALFSLIGNHFGGDGTVTFMLPNLPPVKDAAGREVAYYICLMGNYPMRA